EILHLLLGGASATELVGLSPAAMIVVETDGAIEQSDLLKSVYDGAAATGLHVLRDSFDDALRLPAIAARQLGRAALAGRCRACPISAVCGGGLYVHRYRAGSGFANPSVSCPDLFRLVTRIRSRVAADLAAAARDRSPRSAGEPAWAPHPGPGVRRTRRRGRRIVRRRPARRGAAQQTRAPRARRGR